MMRQWISRVQFESWIAAAVAALPASLRGKLDNVAFVLEEDSTSYLGLYHGIPKPQRTLADSGVLPDKITIYRRPIERQAKTAGELPELVRLVVWHEIGHHFGFSERRIRQLELRWQRRVTSPQK